MRDKDLLAALRERREVVPEVVSRIPASELFATDRQELIDRVVRDTSLIPIKLSEDTRLVKMHEGTIEISAEDESPGSESKARQVMGIQVEIEIPLSGDGWILECEPNTTYRTHPTISLELGYLRLTIGLPTKMDSDAMKKEHEKSFALIEQYVRKINDQINDYNAKLGDSVSAEIDDRLGRLEKIKDAEKIFFSTCGNYGAAS